MKEYTSLYRVIGGLELGNLSCWGHDTLQVLVSLPNVGWRLRFTYAQSTQRFWVEWLRQGHGSGCPMWLSVSFRAFTLAWLLPMTFMLLLIGIAWLPAPGQWVSRTCSMIQDALVYSYGWCTAWYMVVSSLIGVLVILQGHLLGL